MSQEEMLEFIRLKKVSCPKCGKSNFTDIRQFNLMFATQRGVTQDAANTIFLRPENAQGEYVNFINVLRTMRTKLPFSIGQIGKAFRNEITPGNFTFRTIEFEQMEYQTFCKKGQDDTKYEYFKNYGIEFFQFIGLINEHLRFHDHEKLAHYAKAACDIEYLFPFGWGEINGTHNRTDFDLQRHQEFSKRSMEYFDSNSNEKYIPYVIEPSLGVERLVLTVLSDAYHKDTLENGEEREVLSLHPFLAPYKVAVLPLMKKLHSEKAMEIYKDLSKSMMVTYDESGNIGKRYRREDVIGTPFCITIDENTINNNTVTVRDRDTMQQVVINVNDLKDYFVKKIEL
jgi:glycyl-tRNA synthetase